MVAVPGSHAKRPPPGNVYAVVYFRVPQRMTASLTGDCLFPKLFPPGGDERPQLAHQVGQKITEITEISL
jgi:hypothetical protein